MIFHLFALVPKKNSSHVQLIKTEIRGNRLTLQLHYLQDSVPDFVSRFCKMLNKTHENDKVNDLNTLIHDAGRRYFLDKFMSSLTCASVRRSSESSTMS